MHGAQYFGNPPGMCNMLLGEYTTFSKLTCQWNTYMVVRISAAVHRQEVRSGRPVVLCPVDCVGCAAVFSVIPNHREQFEGNE